MGLAFMCFSYGLRWCSTHWWWWWRHGEVAHVYGPLVALCGSKWKMLGMSSQVGFLGYDFLVGTKKYVGLQCEWCEWESHWFGSMMVTPWHLPSWWLVLTACLLVRQHFFQSQTSDQWQIDPRPSWETIVSSNAGPWWSLLVWISWRILTDPEQF